MYPLRIGSTGVLFTSHICFSFISASDNVARYLISLPQVKSCCLSVNAYFPAPDIVISNQPFCAINSQSTLLLCCGPDGPSAFYYPHILHHGPGSGPTSSTHLAVYGPVLHCCVL